MAQKTDSTELQMQSIERKAAYNIQKNKSKRPSEKKTEAQLREAIFGIVS